MLSCHGGGSAGWMQPEAFFFWGGKGLDLGAVVWLLPCCWLIFVILAALNKKTQSLNILLNPHFGRETPYKVTIMKEMVVI